MLSDFLCHLWNLWQAKYLKEFSYVVFQNIYNLHSIFKAMVHHKLIFVYASRNGSVYLTHCLSFICEKYFLSTVELPQCLSEIKSIFLSISCRMLCQWDRRIWEESFILSSCLPLECGHMVSILGHETEVTCYYCSPSLKTGRVLSWQTWNPYPTSSGSFPQNFVILEKTTFIFVRKIHKSS